MQGLIAAVRALETLSTTSLSLAKSFELRLHVSPPHEVVLAIELGESSKYIPGTVCIREGIGASTSASGLSGHWSGLLCVGLDA